MVSSSVRVWLAAAGACLTLAVAVVGAAEPMVFGEQQPEAALPPSGSPALFRSLEIRFPTQGNVPTVEIATYLYYMEVDDEVSLPSQQRWTPFDAALETLLL